MKPKQADILRHASALFNREGYQSPSIERIAEHAGISKMTFYRYYADKEALILAILKQKESEFMQDLAQITADKASAREKLFAVFDYYHRWFTCDTFHGCMFTRALFEYGASSPAIREQCSRFKSLLWQFLPRYPPAGVKTGTCRAGRHDDGDAHRWRYRRSAGRVRRMPGDPTGDHRLERSQSAYLLRRRNAVR